MANDSLTPAHPSVQFTQQDFKDIHECLNSAAVAIAAYDRAFSSTKEATEWSNKFHDLQRKITAGLLNRFVAVAGGASC